MDRCSMSYYFLILATLATSITMVLGMTKYAEDSKVKAILSDLPGFATIIYVTLICSISAVVSAISYGFASDYKSGC